MLLNRTGWLHSSDYYYCQFLVIVCINYNDLKCFGRGGCYCHGFSGVFDNFVSSAQFAALDELSNRTIKRFLTAMPIAVVKNHIYDWSISSST